MKLYSAWYCPFAQRVWMSLLYKGVDFDYIEIDPYQETPEWLALSKGTAQVPVIVVGDESIVDSTFIMTQLDLMFPDTTPLFSILYDKRKNQDIWVGHINNMIIPYFYRYLKSNVEGEYKEESKQMMVAGISTFAEAMENTGPYFMGEHVSVIDISFFPFAHRINLLLGHYRDFALPVSGGHWARYQQWYQKMLAFPEFKTTATNILDYESRLIDFYLPYSLGGGQTDVTDRIAQ